MVETAFKVSRAILLGTIAIFLIWGFSKWLAPPPETMEAIQSDKYIGINPLIKAFDVIAIPDIILAIFAAIGTTITYIMKQFR